MLVFAEGFDDFNSAADAAMTLASSAVVTVVAGRGGIGKAIVTNAGTSWTFAPCVTCIVGFAMDGSNDVAASFSLMNGAAPLFTCSQRSPSGLVFYDSTNTPIGTATYRLLRSYIEIKLTPGNPGSVEVRVDGVTVLSTSVANLGSGAVSTLLQVTPGNGVVFDDLYVCDATGAQNNTFLGDVRITSIAPSGDGADMGFTPNAGSTHYTQVDESPIDYDTTYVNATAAGQSDTYTFPALTTVSGTIAAIQVRAYAKTDSGGTDKLQGIARVAGVDHLASGGDQFIHAVYTGIDSIFELNPATGLPWTLADVNAAQFGQKRTV